jgi:predicted enzyme related to lactoylglutathione lyase
MPTRNTVATGAPSWVDLTTSDVEAARRFYPALFGWTADEPDEQFGGYFMFHHQGRPIAGGMSSQGDGRPDTWAVYLKTDDIEKTLETAVAEGGQVVLPAMPVGDAGTMAFLIDSTGAGIGAWQPKDFLGFVDYAEPNTPSWWELHTREHAKALAFYRSVFGWETELMADTDEFRYAVQKVGDLQSAGVMDASAFLPTGAEPYWTVYFAVEDADAAAAKAVELGGRIVDPPQDTPYGRLATMADPTGAAFRLLGPTTGS